MGERGQPGASLRAWREIFPSAMVFGADIDKTVLFEENRIKTFFVDQMKPATFTELQENCGNELFDLMIDDGLHSPTASLYNLHCFLGHPNVGGSAVIEDVLPAQLPTLEAIDRIVQTNKRFLSYIV